MSIVKTEERASGFIQDKMNEIMNHIAWYGNLSGTEAEVILRNKSDMTYVLRQGERADQFYVTYVKDETEFTHLPFTVRSDVRKWFRQNWRPHFAETLKEFIPEIMHVDEAGCTPLARLA
jgi:hypothetical protein